MVTKGLSPSTPKFSPRLAAIIAGISIVLMAVIAGFSFGFVLETLWVRNDAVATVNNISAAESLFCNGIIGWWAFIILDVAAARALYVFFRPFNRSLALLAAVWRLMFAAILGIATLELVHAISLASDIQHSISIGAIRAQVMYSLNRFEEIWACGLIVFGMHWGALGYLIIKSCSIHKLLGILLLIAACGYLTINLAHLLAPDYKDHAESIFMMPMIIGQLAFGLWLWVKGGKLA